MKKFESLGISLSKEDQRKIVGGVMAVNCLVGWRLDPNVGCFCDFYDVAGTGDVICDQSCPDTMCNSGAIDRDCPYFQ
jgi:hypothetical protein